MAAAAAAARRDRLRALFTTRAEKNIFVNHNETYDQEFITISSSVE